MSPSLGNLVYLSHLNLSHNSLLGPLPKGFFSSLNRLKVLDLSYNHLFGDISGWPNSIQIVDISNNLIAAHEGPLGHLNPTHVTWQ
jgi:hypothetical protein